MLPQTEVLTEHPGTCVPPKKFRVAAANISRPLARHPSCHCAVAKILRTPFVLRYVGGIQGRHIQGLCNMAALAGSLQCNIVYDGMV